MKDQNVRFYLKRASSNKETSIYAKAQINGKPFKYYIGKSIAPDLWDEETRMPISDAKVIKRLRKQEPQLEHILQNISSRIKKVKNALVSYINLREQAGEPYEHIDVKQHLDKKLGISKVSKKQKDLNAFIEDFVTGIENGTRLNPVNKLRYRKGTIKNYKGFKVQFDEYQRIRLRKLDFEDITLSFYNDFVSYFHEKGNKPGAIGRYIKHLKHLMRLAEEEGLHSNVEYKRKEFRVLTSQTIDIYLTEVEISTLSDLDLKDRPNYDLARDVFLLGCYTGLRYSDYSRIDSSHVISHEHGKRFLKLITTKTSRVVQIPVKPAASAILEKYNYQIPRTHPQKVGKYIKEIGKLAGIDQEIEIIQYNGAIAVKKRVPKFQLIKTHTARRSAVTNMYLAGIDPISIMSLTGHKTQKDFMKYLKIDQQQTAELLANHQFFN